MNNLFSFLNPLFNYIDGGKLFRQPFQLFYYLIGIVLALVQLYGIVKVFEIVEYLKGIAYLYAFLMSIVLIVSAFITIVFWIRRAQAINIDVPEDARFLAIPTVGGLIITIGEYLGIVGSFVTFCMGILSAIILPFAYKYGGGEVFLSGICLAVGGVIVSYIVLICMRLIGEQILAIGNIANDTREIVNNTRK